jgi:hypothetical protein
MFADYQELVFEVYKKKRAARALPVGLTEPSPAELKKLCGLACARRFVRKKDEVALMSFFGEGADQVACQKAIDKCDRDRFRPLVNYLNKDGKIDTKEKNIELLAWLIDFEHRPYDDQRNYSGLLQIIMDRSRGESGECSEIEEEPSEELGGQREDETTPPPMATRSLASKFRWGLTFAMTVILTVIAIVIFDGRIPSPGPLPIAKAGGCMYWAGDRYRQIPCDQKPDDALVVPLDSVKFVDFKRITDPDTITSASLGRIWYSKRDGGIEYYTSGGDDPVKPEYRLLPLTEYMIRKHIHPRNGLMIFGVRLPGL